MKVTFSLKGEKISFPPPHYILPRVQWLVKKSSSPTCSSHEFEDVKEQVEDVEVDGDGCEDVLLGGDRELVVAPYHHLRKVNLNHIVTSICLVVLLWRFT